MASAGYLIYSGIMPLIKMYITTLLGFILARRDLFPPAASRGTSQVTMNLALPALIFSSVVPAFTPSNASAIAPLALIAVVYVLLGFVFGLVIREVCYVPRNFWQGIIVATSLSNWGNLPNAIVLSVTQQSPFNPATDRDLGVSFVSIFIVVYHIFFWVVGAAHSLSWDYLPGVPQGQEAEQRVSWKEKPIGGFIAKTFFGYKPTQIVVPELVEKVNSTQPAAPTVTTQNGLAESPLEEADSQALARRTSHLSVVSFRSRRMSVAGSMLPTHAEKVPSPCPPGSTTSSPLPDIASRSSWHPKSVLPRPVIRFFSAISVVITPATLAISVSLPIALIQPLKALFVDATLSGGPSWKGPDGRPPLAFVIDTASFVGSLTVPMALILLGAAFGRLRIPRPISRLPIPAMLLVTVAKMVLLPVIGIFMVQTMAKRGLMPKDVKIELFVAMLLSGTPAAVNQLIVSGLYSPDGDLDTLSAFILVQYIFMFFSSSAITAISLLLI